MKPSRLTVTAISAIMAIALCSCTTRAEGDVVKLDVYYETLCYDSIQFVRNQLVPTYRSLRDNMNVTLIPYGKAIHEFDTTTNQWKFDCQHGQNECRGNRAHACAINTLRLSTSRTPEEQERIIIDLVGCAMAQRNPANAIPQCSQTVGMTQDEQSQTSSCETSGLGNQLLVENGEKTQALTPSLSFVPTITFNGVFTQQDQRNALSNLKGVVCEHIAAEKKPAAC